MKPGERQRVGPRSTAQEHAGSIHGDQKDGLPVMRFRTAAEWERWVAAQPRATKGVWLRLAKKDSGLQSVSRAEAIDVALCHGWIDGQLGSWDEREWVVRFTPRLPRSKWSAVNRKRALELIDAGRMAPAGLDEVRKAQADGRWEEAYASQSQAEVPPDLEAALARNPAAMRFFTQLDSANRYAMLYRVQDAKRPETRARRIAEFVDMLAEGRTLHPARKKRV